MPKLSLLGPSAFRRLSASHAQAWLPAFMQRTQELAAEKPYCAFAALALTVMEVHS